MPVKKLLAISACLLILNICLSMLLFILDDSGSYHLDGSKVEAHSFELMSSLLKAQLISIPVFSLLIGFITSVFIERQLPYLKRYWKGFSWTLTGIYSLFSVSGIIKVALFFL